MAKSWREECAAIIKAAIQKEKDGGELRKMAYALADLQPSPGEAGAPAEASMAVHIVKAPKKVKAKAKAAAPRWIPPKKKGK